MISPLGSAAIPPVPNPKRPTNETALMAEATDRTDAPPFARYAIPFPDPRSKRGIHPVVKIFLESVLVFGLCLLLYFIIREL